MSETLNAPNERTKDHVFWGALGAHATVDACRRCNSTIGSEIEGKLSRDNELYTRHEWRATVVQDDPSHSDPELAFISVEDGSVRQEPKVTTETVAGERRYRLEGTPDQVRRILRNGLGRLAGWDAERIEVEIANARAMAPAVAPSMRVDIEVTHSLDLGRRLAAKVLLGAGALADPDFIKTDLAASLRDVLWARLSPVLLLDNAAIEGLADYHRQQPALAAGPKILRPDALATATYRPSFRHGGTAVLVRVANRPIGLSGFVVRGVWQRATGLPVVVEDGHGGARADFLIDGVLEWVRQNDPGLTVRSKAAPDV